MNFWIEIHRQTRAQGIFTSHVSPFIRSLLDNAHIVLLYSLPSEVRTIAILP